MSITVADIPHWRALLDPTGVTAGYVLTADGADSMSFQPPSGGGGGITVEDEGTPLTTLADTLNFTGAGVTASGTGTTKTINIPGGGGASVQAVWEYKDETGAADPGSGNFRTNNNTIASSTALYFDDETKNGVDFSNLLDALQVDDQIYLQNLEDSTEALLCTITSVTDNTGWFTIGITVDDTGSASTWTDGKEFGVIFVGGGSGGGGGGVFTEDAQNNIYGGTGAGAALTISSVTNYYMGQSAGGSNSLADLNIGIGSSSGRYCSSNENTYVGHESGRALSGSFSTGPGNSGFGYGACRYPVGTSQYNLCAGWRAGYSTLSGCDGNTFIGANSGNQAPTGSADFNTALGYLAGNGITTSAARNLLLGYNAGDKITNSTDTICIGPNAGPTTPQSNQLFIDIAETNTPLIFGNFSTNLLTINGQLESDGNSGSVSFRVDNNATAGETRLLLWDVDNATLARVSVGAANSGGAGFKVLRVPN